MINSRAEAIHVRRISALLIVPVLLLAAACGGGEDRGSDSSSALPAITKGAKFGQKPTVAKGEGAPSDDLQVSTPVKGSGTTVEKGDVITANYLGTIYKSGAVFDNSYDQKKPITTQIGTGSVIKGWDKALVGKKEGSRVEMVVPPSLGYGKRAVGSIPANSTLVFVVDIVGTKDVPDSAKGKAVQPTDANLPKVGANTDGKAPSIEVPTGKATPKKLVGDYVIEGSGPAVKATDTLLVKYKGVLWSTGKEFDSTYAKDTTARLPLSEVVKGFSQGLVGKKVGSRVLLVIPPGLGNGSAAQGGIPANSTLVFSVDILGVL
jgi:FKBP-type peptidyl-prolyl cis-trans isomerase